MKPTAINHRRTSGCHLESPERLLHKGYRLLCLMAVFTMASACATTTAPPASRFSDFPSPLDGPGRTDLDRHATNRISKGWQALTRGDAAAARADAASAGHSPEATLLDLQAKLVGEATPDVVAEIDNLTGRWGEYAAAWITLSVAAQRAGDETTALRAAQRGAELWPSGPFADRPQVLVKRWVDDRIENARLDIERGDWQSALDQLDLVLKLQPDSQPALLAQARALIGLDEDQQAEASLARLGDQPDALMLRAQIAYDDQKWNQAMDLLSRIPESYPGRETMLQRARLWWRLSVLPPFVHQAVNSKALTREQLAVLLVALTPALETLPGGSTPLMEDILRLPSQRSILTVTRLGIMTPDTVDKLFHPDRFVSLDLARDAIEAVSHLVGFPSPIWCVPTQAVTRGCTLLQEPLTGRSVTEALLTAVVEEPER